MSLSRNTTSGTKKIILDYESKYFCLYDNVNNSSQYSIFDFDLSLGTVLNQLNLPVLFCYVTYCIVVVFPSLFHSLQYYTNTTVPRFFRRRLLLLQKCSPRVNINDDNTKPTNLFMVVGWRRDVTKKFRSACENKIVPNTIIFLAISLYCSDSITCSDF